MCFKIWISNKNKLAQNKNYAEKLLMQGKIKQKKLFIFPNILASRVFITYRVYRLYRANRFDGTDRVVFKRTIPLNLFLMDRPPEEVILRILSYLPLSDVFHSVSLVSKDLCRLAYDRQIVANALHLLEEISINENGSLSQEARDKLLNMMRMALADTVKSLSLRNGKRTWELLSRFQEKCRNFLLLNLSGTKGLVTENVTGFVHLRELNVSGTSIDNRFLLQLSQLCCRLYCLNISRCLNVTNQGILQASFSDCLAVINMSYCFLGGESVIHAIREYECTLVCVRGMYITPNLADTVATLFPDILEIGIPIICGFFYAGSSCSECLQLV